MRRLVATPLRRVQGQRRAQGRDRLVEVSLFQMAAAEAGPGRIPVGARSRISVLTRAASAPKSLCFIELERPLLERRVQRCGPFFYCRCRRYAIHNLRRVHAIQQTADPTIRTLQ